MRIVVLDGFTLNPGDLSWEPLHALGECVIHERSAPQEVAARAQDAQALLSNKTPLDAALIDSLPALRYIGVLATGFNVIDMAAARRRGIVVSNVPGYGTASVAQAAFALLLELTNLVGRHSLSARTGRWSAGPDWCFWERPLIELDGLTMGIIGFGSIGQAVAKLAGAFGMKVLAHSRTSRPAPDVRFVDLDDLLRQSDVVSLHCPLTPQTQNLIDAHRLALMKPSAMLLNTARGPLIDEDALADALNAGRLAGAGLDVLATEPPAPDNPLLEARNCVLTPHCAWATKAARQRLLDAVIGNLGGFIAGQPMNVVS